MENGKFMLMEIDNGFQDGISFDANRNFYCNEYGYYGYYSSFRQECTPTETTTQTKCIESARINIPLVTSDGRVLPQLFLPSKSVTDHSIGEQNQAKCRTPTKTQSLEITSKCWQEYLEGTLIPFIFSGCTVLAILQFLLFSPNLSMLFNLLFSLFRMQKYDYKFDCIASLGFALYGVAKLGYDLHHSIKGSFDRWIKMNLMDLENRDC